ncbi:winged helix-turn-helix domain-containing protein [Nonomuraea sp. NPDC001023]|uniref:winged helix-turn-helix domain-containing protein n=1 Tax=unclassified Nonomuraea TaxID=2593643 RepID=UPI00332F26C6
MPIPDFQALMRPVLEMHFDGGDHESAEVIASMADRFELSADERAEMLPSGGQKLFNNRIAWSVTHMAQAGLLERPRRGVTRITDRGRKVLAEHPNRVDMKVLNRFAEYQEFRTRRRKADKAAEESELSAADAPPLELIPQLITEAHTALADELVERLGLLFHYLGNNDSPSAERFRAEIPGWIEATPGRHLPPPHLLGDEQQQAELFTAIAGPYMGANFRKGHTYTWLPNHLMDGAEQVSPRSFLSALTKAVEETTAQYAAHEYAIHHEGIRRGVQAASATRVGEIKEDLPWVQVAIDPLAGQQVPIDEGAVIDLWSEHGLTEALQRQAAYVVEGEKVRTGPRYPDRYSGLIEELIELGVMRRRKDGRIDLPDVYRIAFSIGRKGGVPKVKS